MYVPISDVVEGGRPILIRSRMILIRSACGGERAVAL